VKENLKIETNVVISELPCSHLLNIFVIIFYISFGEGGGRFSTQNTLHVVA